MDGKDVLKMIGRAGLNYLKNGIKKVASKLVASPYFWAAVGIILIIMIITGMRIDVEAQGVGNTDGMYGVTSADGYMVKNTASDKLWNTLKDMGYSDYHAASVLGNIVNESAFNTQALNSSSGAYGLGQWLGGRLTGLTNYANAKGSSRDNVDIQVNYLVAEITGKGDAASYATQRTQGGNGDLHYTHQDWKNATDISNAAIIFCWYFETPSVSSTRGDFEIGQEKKRIASAMAYYEAYTGKTLPTINVTITYTGDGGKGWTCSEGKVSEKFKSNITNLTHSIIYHAKQFGQGECNKGAAFAIASAYTTVDDAVKRMPNNGCLSEGSDGAGSVTVEYFKKYGLNAKLFYASDLSTKVADTVEKGGYVAFHLASPTTINGKKWTGNMHWLSVLSVRQQNGKIEMYVADDSKNQGNPDARWLPIEYFDGADIDKIWVITQAN